MSHAQLLNGHPSPSPAACPDRPDTVKTPLTPKRAGRLVENDEYAAFARRYRLLVLLAVFCSLRWGELAAPRRKHIDTAASLVRIEAAVVELTNGAIVTGPPKSASGVRWVSIPPFLLPDVIEHLDQFTGTAGDQRVFTGPKGAQLRRSNFTRQWRKALEAARMTGIHFHDLRHTGNTLAGEAGASLRELMDRMGHSTTRAALIYQHARRCGTR